MNQQIKNHNNIRNNHKLFDYYHIQQDILKAIEEFNKLTLYKKIVARWCPLLASRSTIELYENIKYLQNIRSSILNKYNNNNGNH